MNRFIFALFIMMFCVYSSYAQKIQKERMGYYKYTQFPSQPLPKDYEAYRVVAYAANDDPYKRDQILQKINIAGYGKADQGQFDVVVEEYPFKISDFERKTSVKTEKKDGIEKKTTYYYYDFLVTYQIKVEVFDQNGENLYSHVFGLGGKHSTKQNVNSSTSYKEYESMAKELPGKLLNDGIAEANKRLDDIFGFPVKMTGIHFYGVKPKKHEYPDFEKALAIATEASEIVKTDENNVDPAMEKFAAAIEQWNNALKESDIEDKKARVDEDVTMAAHYNIGMAYLLCKDYPKAIEAFNKCMAIKEGFSDAKQLVDFSNDMISRIDKYNSL